MIVQINASFKLVHMMNTEYNGRERERVRQYMGGSMKAIRCEYGNG